MRRTSAVLAAMVLMTLAFNLPARAAALKSARGPLVKNQVTEVALELGGVKVVSYRFARETRGGANPFKGGSGPTLDLVVRNDAAEPRDFSLAVALFDQSGNLVGAGTTSHTGRLKPGEQDELKVVFKDLNQSVARAATVHMSLELSL